MSVPPNISGAPAPEQEVDVAFATDGPIQDQPAPSLPDDVRADLDAAEVIMAAEDPVYVPEKIPVMATLPSGGKVWFKQPDELVARDTKPAIRAFTFGGMVDFIDALAPKVIKQWDLQDRRGRPIKPPSINEDAMDELTPTQWGEIGRWLAIYKGHLDPPVRKNPPDA